MLWWAYFDVDALVAERRLHEAVGVEQLRIARDSYALLHLPMIAGIVLFALGVKKVLEHTGDPLKDMPAVALCGGLALYALAYVAFRWRNTGTFSVPRTVAALACLAVIPLALEALALVALAVLGLIWITLIAFETVRVAAYRQEVREGSDPRRSLMNRGWARASATGLGRGTLERRELLGAERGLELRDLVVGDRDEPPRRAHARERVDGPEVVDRAAVLPAQLPVHARARDAGRELDHVELEGSPPATPSVR